MVRPGVKSMTSCALASDPQDPEPLWAGEPEQFVKHVSLVGVERDEYLVFGIGQRELLQGKPLSASLRQMNNESISSSGEGLPITA